MSEPEPEPEADAEARRRERRRQQRRLARTHHPDLGADPEQYVRLMRDLDRRLGLGPEIEQRAARPTTGGPVLVTTRSRPRTALRRGFHISKQMVRAVRAQLPRRVPGARRYIDL